MSEYKAVKIGDFLKRIKRSIVLENKKEYKLVTVKLHHKGVALRELKKGCNIGSKMYEVKSGDFILSGIDARNGAFGIVGDELDGAIVTNDFWYFELNDKLIHKHFFLELTSIKWFDEICRLGSDGTTQRIRLQKDRFFNQNIYLPTIEKQKELSKKFILIKSAKQKLDEKNSDQNNYLANLRQQILQDAISGELTADWRTKNPDIKPASKLIEQIKAEKEKLIAEKKVKKEKPLPKIIEDEMPFDVPDKWEWCRLGEVGFAQTGTTPPTQDRNNFGEYISFIKPADIKISWNIDYENEKLSNKGLGLGRLIESGSVMMVCIGGSIGKSGICSMNVSCNQQINTITPLADADSWYIQYLLQSPYFQKTVWSRASGGTTPIVNKTKWETIPFPLPPLAEQKAIVSKVEKLMSYVSELEEKIKQNKQDAEVLMQSFLVEAFEN
jgi:restriction endonuclease S subunit